MNGADVSRAVFFYDGTDDCESVHQSMMLALRFKMPLQLVVMSRKIFLVAFLSYYLVQSRGASKREIILKSGIWAYENTVQHSSLRKRRVL